MSCPDRPPLPAELGLQPRWRDLPRLVRVEGRAFGWFAPPFTPHQARQDRPTGSPVRAAANEVWSWLVLPAWVALHLGLRAGGRTACLGSTAVLTVTPRGKAANRARQPRTALRMAGAGLLGVVLGITGLRSHVAVLRQVKDLLSPSAFPRYIVQQRQVSLLRIASSCSVSSPATDTASVTTS